MKIIRYIWRNFGPAFLKNSKIFDLSLNLLRGNSVSVLKRKYVTKELFEKQINNSGSIIQSSELTNFYSSIFRIENEFNYPVKHEAGRFHYVLELRNPIIIGDSSVVILDDKYALYDILFVKDNGNIKFSDPAILSTTSEQVYLYYRNVKNNKIKSGILLSGNFSFNYFHFFYEFISRIEYIDSLGLDKSVPFIVDEQSLKYDQFKELIRYFNKDNRGIVAIKKGVSYKIEHLYYAASPNFIVPNFANLAGSTNITALYNFKNLTYLRNVILKKKLVDKLSYDKIFISRGKSGKLRNYNEEAVQAFLVGRGFTVVHPEIYSILEQASVFHDASVIIGASGAAFTNLLYCKKETKVLCLMAFDVSYSIFATIASFIGFEIHYLFDDGLALNNKTDLQTSFQISIREIDQVLKHWNL
ncbi:MAG: glycosyltransferase 61 family protein [Ferruginibacter sp.]